MMFNETMFESIRTVLKSGEISSFMIWACSTALCTDDCIHVAELVVYVVRLHFVRSLVRLVVIIRFTHLTHRDQFH